MVSKKRIKKLKGGGAGIPKTGNQGKIGAQRGEGTNDRGEIGTHKEDGSKKDGVGLSKRAKYTKLKGRGFRKNESGEVQARGNRYYEKKKKKRWGGP